MVLFSMERQKRWHTWLIAGVTVLTAYNILPTLLFYSNPLSEKIGAKRAFEIQNEIANRVNLLEKDSKDWIHSYAELIGVKLKSIEIDPNFSDKIEVVFNQSEDAKKFKQLLPRAGNLIPFYPLQLALGPDTLDTLKVEVQRKIPIHFGQEQRQEMFRFIEKYSDDGSPTEGYKQIGLDRVFQIANSLGGVSEAAELVSVATQNLQDHRAEEPLLQYAQTLLDYKTTFGEKSPATKRFICSLTQAHLSEKTTIGYTLMEVLTALKDRCQKERLDLQSVEQANDQTSLTTLDKDKILQLQNKEEKLRDSLYVVKNHLRDFQQGSLPLSYDSIEASWAKHGHIPLQKNNPLFSSIHLDFEKDQILLELHQDVESVLIEGDAIKKEAVQSLIYKELARLSRETSEEFKLHNHKFVTPLSTLQSSKSILVLQSKPILEKILHKTESRLQLFEPQTVDLNRENYPVVSFKDYQHQILPERGFQAVLYAPGLEGKFPLSGFKSDSCYVIFKDFYKIYRKYASLKNETAKAFNDDLKQLNNIFQQQGFIAYPGAAIPLNKEFAEDLIFELPSACEPTVAATRENFYLKGSKTFALLEFTDVRQRILTVNQIESKEQEDLLRMKDLYHTSQIDPSLRTYYDAPKPIRSTLWNNFIISMKKYYRGDDRKVLKWGLDLSGGKTVEIQLKDPSGKTVTNEFDLKQGVNELFNRVNKMGVSEVSIRIEGSNIILDFPGSQDISASDLIRSSSMTFHVVNEKFSLNNISLRDSTNRFLQDIWSEAIVKGKKEAEQVHKIAYSQLYGDAGDAQNPNPKTEAARLLLQAGLALAHPEKGCTNAFDETLSRVAVIKGETSAAWEGQTHPLLIVFNNYALEGSSLETVRASYDPKNGNFLSFEVKATKKNTNGTVELPQSMLSSWTKVFCQDKVIGTDLEQYSHARGWRMAVVLNGTVISSPSLNAEIKDKAMITGNFSQREASKLESDLRAGSLTYTPNILSENNVSPELGLKERTQGIFAAVAALLLVVAIMCSYYRFFGFIASIAVLFNLLILWAVLQNIGASLTLAGIAAIVLTIGMSVDANVLVFERIREEYKIHKNLATAIHNGYSRAFSAILDSNVTTVIAALILLNFDAGPVKGFALTLIIGVASSMFTAYFTTRTFFYKWVEKRGDRPFKIGKWIEKTSIPFLKLSVPVAGLSLCAAAFGGYALYKNQANIYGMDFTGGYSLLIEVSGQNKTDPKYCVEQALKKAGIRPQEMQVRELSTKESLRVFLAKSLDEANRPFSGMGLTQEQLDPSFAYKSNPRLNFVMESLQQEGVQMTDASLNGVHFTFKSVSGQMSDAMRKNAIIGLAVALLAILVYITLRFEFKYAISATLGLAYDIVITLSILALLHQLGLPVQIDLNVVAALMTIAGYSLNDTIIVFDRIREDQKHDRKMPFKQLVNRSLNVTLSRTLLTSTTTLVVLVCMVILGGNSIFGFSLLMSIGIVVGTLSSFFISSMLLVLFDAYENREVKVISELNS
ncbi:MAG: protein translocase subunit SecD [Chlamydiae bacterium]|nr:protein translocase subunit SecD [Chlamydiota bacterium]